MGILDGNAVSGGISIGKIFVYKPFTVEVNELHFDNEDSVDEQKCKYEKARESAKAELEEIINNLSVCDPDKCGIFQAHIDFLFDEAIEEEIVELIEEELMEPVSAVSIIYNQYAEMIGNSRDKLLAERSADLLDVRMRLIRNLYGIPEKNLSKLPGPVIIAAHDLLPSDTATIDRDNVLGIITETGGDTSHSAIIARSYGIPAVLGINSLLSKVNDNQAVIVDAVAGKVIIEPDSETEQSYVLEREKYNAEEAVTREYLDKAPQTKDGVRVNIGLNLGSADTLELQQEKYADYVGLFRTEFLYMGSDHMPSEEEQFEAYKKVLMAFSGRHVIIRTLDIGGDKTLSFMSLPKEENPFLGNRALRLCFDEPELFKTQLRALLRASVYGELWIMLPMVGSIEDIRKAKSIIEATRDELIYDGFEVCGNLKVGVMIEIPSLAMMADKVSMEVDFASIGTNDLCQYLTAVDRMNPQVAQYYQSFHPAMFRLMANVIDSFNAAGKPVSVCGELGGNTLAVPVLVGLGMKTLSMSVSSVAGVKRVLSQYSVEEMKELASEVINCSTQEEVIKCIKERQQ